MSNPVTCIIPVRNGAATIERAVKSAIDAGCELVIIYNDNSTDDTDDIITSLYYKHEKVDIFTSLDQVRGGVVFSRNHLISSSPDGLIICLDADDTLNDIAPLVASWQPGTWVYGDYNVHAGEQVQRVKGCPAGTLPNKEITGVTFLFHKDDWKRVGGFDPDFAVCEDYGFQCALVNAGVKPQYVETVVYDRYIKPEGNERTVLAREYWQFYNRMARRKYQNVFRG